MKGRTERIDETLIRELKEIKFEIEKKGKCISIRRITKGMPKLSSWPEIKVKLINAEWSDDRRIP